MGLPEIDINFKQKAITAINRSQQGVVAIIIVDDTDETFDIVEYKSVSEIESEKFSVENIAMINDAFLVPINKLIIARISTTDEFSVGLALLENKVFDWCSTTSSLQADQDALLGWVKTRNLTNSKKAKAVIYNATTSDDMHIVNFTNNAVKKVIDESSITGDKYLVRLTALFAYLSIEQSGTYYKLTDLESVTEVADSSAAIDNGELVLINDEEEVRIGRAINSLTTLDENLIEDKKSILIVEAMDLIYYDIHSNYKNNFLGLYKNSYDNQALFVSSVTGYFKNLEKENILDPNYFNNAHIDIEAQLAAWIEDENTEASTWTEQEIKNNVFKNKIFMAAEIKILNAMEDLTFDITIA